ncbi:hypothetical protein AB1Y20_001972 [Prymnesium parvum]|uniref:Uncharacterized protein n=1 Tax=Prymnesium parvum TaxID=97485 RepID=A0AB34J9T9_PRYPA
MMLASLRREVDELSSEKRRLLDALQVSEMRLSQEVDEHGRDLRLKREAEKHANHWRKLVQSARDAAAAACESEQNMKRQLKLAEREARTLSFQNLSLSRQLELLADHVPRSELQAMRVQLETRIAVSDERIATLEAELADRDAAAEACEDAEQSTAPTDSRHGKRKRALVTSTKLRESVGIEGCRQVPARRYDCSTGTAGMKVWVKRSVQHIAAVLRDRPMTHILQALRHRLTELAECRAFACEGRVRAHA